MTGNYQLVYYDAENVGIIGILAQRGAGKNLIIVQILMLHILKSNKSSQIDLYVLAGNSQWSCYCSKTVLNGVQYNIPDFKVMFTFFS